MADEIPFSKRSVLATGKSIRTGLKMELHHLTAGRTIAGSGTGFTEACYRVIWISEDERTTGGGKPFDTLEEACKDFNQRTTSSL